MNVVKFNRKAIVVADVGGTNGRIRIYLKSIHDSGNRIDIVDENPWFERIYRMALLIHIPNLLVML